MTQAAISYQVKALEQRLGAALFRRAGRNVELTGAGQRLSATTSEAFGLLRAACAGVTGLQSTQVHITALPTVASNWLVPRLGDFQLQHPNYAVRLDSSVGVVDLRTSEFDVAIRTGDGQWTGCKADRLFPSTYTVVCSPRLIADGVLSEPRDLCGRPLFGRESWWRSWLAATGVDGATLAVSDLGTQPSEVTAALTQDGAAIVTPAFFASDIRAGRLAIPFPTELSDERDYWLVYGDASKHQPNVSDFRRWILSVAEPEAVA